MNSKLMGSHGSVFSNQNETSHELNTLIGFLYFTFEDRTITIQSTIFPALDCRGVLSDHALASTILLLDELNNTFCTHHRKLYANA